MDTPTGSGIPESPAGILKASAKVGQILFSELNKMSLGGPDLVPATARLGMILMRVLLFLFLLLLLLSLLLFLKLKLVGFYLIKTTTIVFSVNMIDLCVIECVRICWVGCHPYIVFWYLYWANEHMYYFLFIIFVRLCFSTHGIIALLTPPLLSPI